MTDNTARRPAGTPAGGQFTTRTGSAPDCDMLDATPVLAEMRSDDEHVRLDTDVTAWLAEATDDQIVDLAACGFGGDYAADDVAYGLADEQQPVAAMLDHARSNDVGFEVHVDQQAATQWILANRRHLMGRITGTDFDNVSSSYIEAALWSSIDYDNDDTPLDEDFDADDFEPSERLRLDTELAEFVIANRDDLDGMDASQIGHDFWLTRNGHGAGFWDRGLGERGSRLSDASKVYGEATIYVGDNGKLYLGSTSRP